MLEKCNIFGVMTAPLGNYRPVLYIFKMLPSNWC